jgi:hypothetical protein
VLCAWRRRRGRRRRRAPRHRGGSWTSSSRPRHGRTGSWTRRSHGRRRGMRRRPRRRLKCWCAPHSQRTQGFSAGTYDSMHARQLGVLLCRLGAKLSLAVQPRVWFPITMSVALHAQKELTDGRKICFFCTREEYGTQVSAKLSARRVVCSSICLSVCLSACLPAR